MVRTSTLKSWAATFNPQPLYITSSTTKIPYTSSTTKIPYIRSVNTQMQTTTPAPPPTSSTVFDPLAMLPTIYKSDRATTVPPTSGSFFPTKVLRPTPCLTSYGSILTYSAPNCITSQQRFATTKLTFTTQPPLKLETKTTLVHMSVLSMLPYEPTIPPCISVSSRCQTGLAAGRRSAILSSLLSSSSWPPFSTGGTGQSTASRAPQAASPVLLPGAGSGTCSVGETRSKINSCVFSLIQALRAGL